LANSFGEKKGELSPEIWGAFARNLGVVSPFEDFAKKKMIAQKLRGKKQSHEMPKLFYSIYKKSKFLFI